MRRPRYPWMIAAATAFHLIWGVCLLFSGDPLDATPVHHLKVFMRHHVVAGAFLIVVATGAFWSLLRPRSLVGMLSILPQQMTLWGSGIGGIIAVCLGEYADGTVRPRLFILADQSLYIVTAVLHTMALIDVHGGEIVDHLYEKARYRLSQKGRNG